MTSLLIEDLSRSEDLDRHARLAVRGGILIKKLPDEGPTPVEPDGGTGAGPAGPSIPGLPSTPGLPDVSSLLRLLGGGCWTPRTQPAPFDLARLQ